MVVLLEPDVVAHSHMDDILSKDEVIINDSELKSDLAKSKKLEKVGEIKVTIGKSLNLINKDELCYKKGKEAETLLARILEPPFHSHMGWRKSFKMKNLVSLWPC